MIFITGIRQKMDALWFRRHRGRLGVDLQGTTVRVVHTRTLPQGGTELVSFGSMAVDPFHLDDKTLPPLCQFLKQHAGPTRTVALGLEHETLRIRRMDLPPMPDADLREAIRWNFREHVDVSLEEYHIDFLPLPGLSLEGMKSVLAFGVAKAVIRERMELVDRWGLKLGWLEPAATAILQAFSTNNLLPPNRTIACLVLDETTALLTVMRDASLLFSRPLVVGSCASLVQLSEKDSERVLSELVVDIERSFNAFSLQYGTESINEIFVCGAALASPGLLEHIHSSLGPPVRLMDPFANSTLIPPAPNDPQERSLYTIAMGLSLL